MHNRKAVTKVLYHVFVILFGFMMVYPVLWMISGSFKGNAEILRGTQSTKVDTKNIIFKI